MFVVPDFMAPAFSCVMARRWRLSRRWRHGVAARGVPTPPVRRHGDGVVMRVGLHHQHAAAATARLREGTRTDAARAPITASDGRHLRL